jgi:hypothetical protein
MRAQTEPFMEKRVWEFINRARAARRTSEALAPRARVLLAPPHPAYEPEC